MTTYIEQESLVERLESLSETYQEEAIKNAEFGYFSPSHQRWELAFKALVIALDKIREGIIKGDPDLKVIEI